jgi:hypothetical protein
MPTTPENLQNVAPQQAMTEVEAPEAQEPSGQAEVAKMKREISSLIGEGKVSPQQLTQLGVLAEQSIKDKALFPVLKKAAVQTGIMSPADFKEGIDYQVLAYLIVIGKVTQQMIQAGQFGRAV